MEKILSRHKNWQEIFTVPLFLDTFSIEIPYNLLPTKKLNSFPVTKCHLFSESTLNFLHILPSLFVVGGF
jgi:hypothetical protein